MMKTIPKLNLSKTAASRLIKVLALSGAAFALQACGGSDSNDNSLADVPGYDANIEYSDIAGIWRFIEPFEVSNNEIYVVISEQGVFTELDYLGDAFDNADNCYTEDRDENFLVAQNGQIFLYNDDDGELFGKLALNPEGDLYPLVNGQALASNALERVNNLQESDLSPLCD